MSRLRFAAATLRRAPAVTVAVAVTRILGPLLLIVAPLAAAAAPLAAASPVPNVVILYADDMGYGDLGANNPDSKIPTPHLDRLASAGTRFTDAHSSSGVCTPSRYALLHGRYHWRKFHGIVQSFDQPILDAERTTLAELLRGRGYATAAFGKWHLGWDWEAIRRAGAEPRVEGKTKSSPPPISTGGGRSRGPARPWLRSLLRRRCSQLPPFAWFEDDRIPVAPTLQLVTTGEPPEGNWECRPGPMVHGWDFHAVMPTLTDRAVAWIEQQTPDRPFFLYFPFTSPHAPILPTAAFTGRSAAGPYGDFVAQTDDTVGRVLDALEREGFADNTLVIFTSDNGPERYAYEPHPRLRPPQHGAPSRAEARPLGRGPSGADDRPLAGACARRKGGRRPRQPDRSLRHDRRGGRGGDPGGLGGLGGPGGFGRRQPRSACLVRREGLIIPP